MLYLRYICTLYVCTVCILKCKICSYTYSELSFVIYNIHHIQIFVVKLVLCTVCMYIVYCAVYTVVYNFLAVEEVNTYLYYLLSTG